MVPLALYTVSFLEHDAAEMQRQAAGIIGKPGVEDQMFFLESETAVYGGEFAMSRANASRLDSAEEKIKKKLQRSMKRIPPYSNTY